MTGRDAEVANDKLSAACHALLDACRLALPFCPSYVGETVKMAVQRATDHVGEGCEQKGCEQKGCQRAVALAHVVRTAARIADDQGHGSISSYLRKGLRAATGEPVKKLGTPF